MAAGSQELQRHCVLLSTFETPSGEGQLHVCPATPGYNELAIQTLGHLRPVQLKDPMPISVTRLRHVLGCICDMHAEVQLSYQEANYVEAGSCKACLLGICETRCNSGSCVAMYVANPFA
jgi:hypothetical protein